ncbi:epidermal growth factor receptor kinase substrate 8-like protein 3 isoform X2 [Notamacropus eugenii]|uniref:epidermal growth factor receptor kinase substrate 8-like protein 3 isoform X2 n=1 Tax=Notamacropus eugenii TaxID=9315 RepID=UPI003B670918
MDYVTHRDDWPYQESRSALNRSNSMSRPSSKTIYQQRKEYSQAMASEPIILKQRVEHLITCKLGSGTIQEPKDVIRKLQMMDAQGQVWGQDMVLQVKNHSLQILDIETREELDSYPLDGIQSLDAILNSCSYKSILLIVLQELAQPFTSILAFQCWEVGAEILRNNLQKAINESKERKESRFRFEGIQPNQQSWEANPPKYPQNSIEQRFLASYQPTTQEPQGFTQFPSQKADPEPPLDMQRDIVNISSLNLGPSDFWHSVEGRWGGMKEGPFLVHGRPEAGPMAKMLGRWARLVLVTGTGREAPACGQWYGILRECRGHWPIQGQRLSLGGAGCVVCTQEELNNTLEEIELFVEMAKGTQKNKAKKKKKILGKKTPKGLPSESQYRECFQKIKHSFNLLGKLDPYLQPPDIPNFVHLLFQALNSVMSNCPNPHLAASVDVPWLTPKTIALLDSCLTPNEMDFWKSLGKFWTTSMDDGADQQSTSSTYIPRIHRLSESSESSTVTHQHNLAKDQDPIVPRPSLSQQPLLMQVQYEFKSKNPQELTVAQGEVLEILDQSKQWWLVENESGQRGYIPNSILEPLQSGLQRNRGWSSSLTRGPMLRPTSKPQEVRDWLESEKFSTITIKSLGMLTGSQLLHMQPRELQLVCPKDAPRILDRLEAVRMTLGMGP